MRSESFEARHELRSFRQLATTTADQPSASFGESTVPAAGLHDISHPIRQPLAIHLRTFRLRQYLPKPVGEKIARRQSGSHYRIEGPVLAVLPAVAD